MTSVLRKYSAKYFYQLSQSRDACLNAFLSPFITLTENSNTYNTFITDKSTLNNSTNHDSSKPSSKLILDTIPTPAITKSTLTDDLDLLLAINPELEGAIESIKSSHLEDYEGNIRNSIESLALEHGASCHPTTGAINVTKTCLGKARIDQLREGLEAIGADSRGNKVALVDRILKIYKGQQQYGRSSAVTGIQNDTGLLSHQQQPVPKNPNSTLVKNVPSALLSQQSKPRIPIEKLKYARPFTNPMEVANILLQAHAQDVVIIDIREQCTFTDYMVLATGISHGAVRLLAQAVMHELKSRCREAVPSMSPSVEGRVGKGQQVDWLVVDAGSVVAHVFTEQGRKEYDLEGLWVKKSGDADEGSNLTRLGSRKEGGTGDVRQTLNTIKL